MKGEIEVTRPEIALAFGTRAALGVGLGFLLAGRFSEETRRAIGWTLLLGAVAVGGIQGATLFGNPRQFHMKFGPRQNPDGRTSAAPESLRRETVRAGD